MTMAVLKEPCAKPGAVCPAATGTATALWAKPAKMDDANKDAMLTPTVRSTEPVRLVSASTKSVWATIAHSPVRLIYFAAQGAIVTSDKAVAVKAYQVVYASLVIQ